MCIKQDIIDENGENIKFSCDGEGEHTLQWVFWKDADDGEDVGADCAMLDYVRWYPAGEEPPQIGNETLDEFYEWLKAHGQLSPEQQTSANASPSAARSIARSLLGASASGKSVSLLREFIAGTDPQDENDTFSATISFDADGNPVVTPSTGSLTEQQIAQRKYIIYGKKSLADEDWTKIEGAETTKDFNFFYVTVELIDEPNHPIFHP